MKNTPTFVSYVRIDFPVQYIERSEKEIFNRNPTKYSTALYITVHYSIQIDVVQFKHHMINSRFFAIQLSASIQITSCILSRKMIHYSLLSAHSIK